MKAVENPLSLELGLLLESLPVHEARDILNAARALVETLPDRLAFQQLTGLSLLGWASKHRYELADVYHAWKGTGTERVHHAIRKQLANYSAQPAEGVKAQRTLELLNTELTVEQVRALSDADKQRLQGLLWHWHEIVCHQIGQPA